MSVEHLAERVRAALAGKKTAEQVMFRGTAFMLDGNFAVSASPRGLLVRVGKDGIAAALKRNGARRMVMGKRVMAGYIFVDDEGIKTAKDLAGWIGTALDHVATLPAKKSQSKTTLTFGAAGDIRKHTGWFIGLGIVFIIGGVLAIAMPLLASITVALVVGWSLIFVGVVQLIQAWSMRSWGGVTWQIIIGLVFLVGGIGMIVNPIVAAVTLTLLLGAVFVAKGVMQLILGFRFRPHAGWGWIVAAGVLAVVVGLMILFSWPFSTVWALGTLAGISLIFSGWSYIMIALAARRLAS